MKTISGVVTWIQPNWSSYQPKWGNGRQTKYFRKLSLYVEALQDNIECVAWEQRFWQEVHTGQQVTLEGVEKVNSYNNKPQFTIRKMEVGDYYREFKTVTVTNIFFHYEYITFKSDEPWIKGSANDPNVHPILQKYRNLLTENVQATIEGTPVVVRFKMGKPCSWFFDKASNARIVNHNWGSLEKAAQQDADAKKWREYVTKLKTKLESIIDLKDAQQLAEEMGVKCSEEDLIAVIFKPEYDREYFDHLKTRAKSIKFTNDSFLFETKDAIIWEKPKMGSATYVFKLQDINTLAARIDSLGQNVRSSIRANTNIASELQFAKVIIHNNFEQWINDLEK